MKVDPLVDILIKEFGRKKSRNKYYSLRSFSRDLEIDPSNLCKILNRKKKVGPALRSKLAIGLGFEFNDIQGWLKPTVIDPRADEKYNSHDRNIFETISNWQHYAVLECFKLKNNNPTDIQIADMLGLKRQLVKDSLRRLVKVGLLLKTRDGYCPSDTSSSSILNIATSKAHREHQSQILEGAIDALKNIPIESRSQSSMTMAIDSNNLEKAKLMIKAFRRELGLLLSSSVELDSVYQLSISLYPVTTIKKQGEQI